MSSDAANFLVSRVLSSRPRKYYTVYYFALIDPTDLLPLSLAIIIGRCMEYFIVSLALLIGKLYDLKSVV